MRRLGFLLLALLSACGATPPLRAVKVTPDGVAYAYPANRRDEARRQATLYCANLGRAASLQEVKPDGSGAGIAVFECRQPDPVSAAGGPTSQAKPATNSR